MITIVRHEPVLPSYFYITNNNELANIPKCGIDSKVINLNTKDLWILCSTTTGRCWHKYGTNQEVPC